MQLKFSQGCRLLSQLMMFALIHLPCAGLDFVFHMFFLVKYCKTLEEGSFRGRSSEFLWMLLIGKTIKGTVNKTMLHQSYGRGQSIATVQV